jgi:Kef-type K+ transport system membrane component KefB
MQTLTEHQLLDGLVSLAIILVIGRSSAEFARRVRQPEVLGELFGGVLLGPSVLGALFPHLSKHLFANSAVTLPLSLFSWTGAILLLLLAGAEVDLGVMHDYRKAGLWTATFMILASIIAGTIFGVTVLHQELPSAIFLGAVMSVTAVSVIAKILIERGELRRSYAQVILGAGIASEIVVWPLISVLSAVKTGNTLVAGITTTSYAIAFIVFMLTIGQRFVDWAMRRIVDVTQIIYGQLSLVIVLAIFFASITQILGLHALLGPFIFGLLIGRAPRATNHLKESLHSMTLSVFAPVFFVLAGMRVNVPEIANVKSLTLIVLLFLVASLAKIGFAFIGAKIGGMRLFESLLIGLGANMRGGSDVIVAILGTSIGLLDPSIYSIYAIVAILTVLLSPPAIGVLAGKVPPSEEEGDRLKKEQAKKRAYLSGVERLLLPTFIALLPTQSVPVVKAIAATKEKEEEIFDIIELSSESDEEISRSVAEELKDAQEAVKTEYSKATSDMSVLEAICTNAEQCDLLMIGAKRPLGGGAPFSLGKLQDKIIETAHADIFVMIGGNLLISRAIKRIIVPVNGIEYSLAAADIAAYIAKSTDAEVVLFNVIKGTTATSKRNTLAYHRIRKAGYKVLREAKFRTRRLDVTCESKVSIANDSDGEIMRECRSTKYDLLILGVVNRAGDSGFYLGAGTHALISETSIPTGLLIVHQAGTD